ESVDVITLEPEQRVVDEKTRDFAAAEIVDGGVPIRMKAAPRIVVLVERGAVEARQPVLIRREMRRHPVENDAESRRVRLVDETCKARGTAEAGRRRKQTGRLISPRRIEGMLRDRQKLDVREAHVPDVGDQGVPKLVIAQEAAIIAATP